MPNSLKIALDKNTYIKANTSTGSIVVEATDYEIHAIVSDTQPLRSAENFHRIVKGDSKTFSFPTGDVWLISTANKSEAIVTEGMAISSTSDRGDSGILVKQQDPVDGVLSIPFLETQAALSLAVNTVVNARTITLTPGHGLVSPTNDGETIEIADTTDGSVFIQAKIILVAGDVVTLDSPINSIYTTTESLIVHSLNQMAVDGSVTPVVFSIAPLPAQEGNMNRVIVNMIDNTAMDFETFGGIPALTNGCIVRVNNGDGTYRNIANFKSNNDIVNQCFDHNFFLNNGGNTRGFTARLSWAGQEKHGTAIRVNGGLSETLEVVIQDDLTALTGMSWIAQGREQN